MAITITYLDCMNFRLKRRLLHYSMAKFTLREEAGKSLWIGRFKKTLICLSHEGIP